MIAYILREQVQGLEKELIKQTDQMHQLSFRKDNAQIEYTAVLSQMGWREKYLAGWFGGDNSLVQKSRDIGQQLGDYDSKLASLQASAKNLDARINDIIKSYLVQNDPAYRQLHAGFERVAEVINIAASYMKLIDAALSEIGDAEDMEFFDLASSNKGISALSWMENEEAQEAIDAIKEYTKTFQAALRKYNDFLKENLKEKQSLGLGRVEIDDGIDFVFDMVFDGFDFMSLFTLENLDNADSDLRQLRSKVSDAKNKIAEEYEKVELQVLAYVKSVRSACR